MQDNLHNILELGGAVTKGLTVEDTVVVEWVEDSGGWVAVILTVDCADEAGVIVDDDVCVDGVVTADGVCVDDDVTGGDEGTVTVLVGVIDVCGLVSEILRTRITVDCEVVAGVVVDDDVCVDDVVTADGVCVDVTGGDEGTVTGVGVIDVCGLVSEILRTRITVDCEVVAGGFVDDDVCVDDVVTADGVCVDGVVIGNDDGTVTVFVGVIDVCGLESEILRTCITVYCVVVVDYDVCVDDVGLSDDERTVTGLVGSIDVCGLKHKQHILLYIEQ